MHILQMPARRGQRRFSFLGIRLLAIAVLLIFETKAPGQGSKATFPIDAPPQDDKLYIIRTVDTQEALFVALQDQATAGTRLALKAAANDFSQWKFLRTAGGERFIRAKGGTFFLHGAHGFRVPGANDQIATNADVDHAQWRNSTNIVIAVQAPQQTWEAEDTGDGNGSFYLKSLLGTHIGRTESVYMGYTDYETDPNEGKVRWVVLRSRDAAAKWWFVPVN